MTRREKELEAIRIHEFGPPEVMKLEEVPDPQPGTHEVVVKTCAVGVNPVETYIRSGAYSRLPSLPYIPGNDAAGLVEAVGKGVEGLAEGDRVFLAGTISGTYAEKALCRAGKWDLATGYRAGASSTGGSPGPPKSP